MRIVLLFALAVVLGTGGCSTTLFSEGRFSFSATRPDAASAAPFARVTETARGQVRFAGRISTPTPCYRVTGAGDVFGSEITISVAAASALGPGQQCAQVVGGSDYSGVVRELASGSYRVIVIHMVPGTGWPTQTVADSSVAVP